MKQEKNSKMAGTAVIVIILATVLIPTFVDAFIKADVTEQIERAMDLLLKLESGTPIDDVPGASGSDGGTSWWWAIPIILIILALLYGGFRIYRKRQEGNVQAFENRIIELLRVSADILVHIGEKLNLTQGAFNTREKAIWSLAVETENVPFHRLTDNQIITHITNQVQAQLNNQHAGAYEFRPNMPANERPELINNVSIAVSNIIIARKLINDFIHKKLTNRLGRLERLERRNSDILESPVVHADRSVMFMLNTAHAGAPGPSINDPATPVVVEYFSDNPTERSQIDMNLRRGTIWEARSPPLDSGAYRYHFLVMRQGNNQQQSELDPRNNHRIEDIGTDKFNSFEITGQSQQAIQPPTQQTPRQNPPAQGGGQGGQPGNP